MGCSKLKIKIKAMKKIILLLSILISFTAHSQCVIDGTTYTGTTKARTFKSCDAIIQSLSDGMVKSHGDSVKTAIPDVDYATPSLVSNGFTNWSNTKQYATGNTVIFGNNIYTANTTPTLGNNPGGNAQWTLQIISPVAYTGNNSWDGISRAPTVNFVGNVFDAIYDSLADLTPIDTSLFLKKIGGTMSGDIDDGGNSINNVDQITDFSNVNSIGINDRTLRNNSGNVTAYYHFCQLYTGTGRIRMNWINGWLYYDDNTNQSIHWTDAMLLNKSTVVTLDWDSTKVYGNWKVNSINTDSLSIVAYSQLLAIKQVKGTFSATGTASTSFTVTLPSTLANSSYIVSVMPTSLLSATGYYITGRSTTQFTINYVTGLTGSVTFEYSITK